MIDLFRVRMTARAGGWAHTALTPDSDGRLYVGQGRAVDEFEAAFGTLVEAPYPTVALNSCTSALDLAYELIGIGPGDEVITTPITCTATNLPLLRRGARIVWADVDRMTGCIDPADVARKVTKRTKAIVAVDWGGRPCDYDALRSFGVPVVEDAAHALLARYNGKSIAQTGGDYVCWSLGPIKHLCAVDGGMLLAPLEQMERARLLRWYGLDRTSTADFRCQQDIREAGTKSHMNDVNATIGLANLEGIGRDVDRHRDHARVIASEIRGPGLTIPPYTRASSYWVFTLLADDRDGFAQHMADADIQVSRVHARNDKHTVFAPFADANLAGVDSFDAHQVNIPCGWWLDHADVNDVALRAREWAFRDLALAVRT